MTSILKKLSLASAILAAAAFTANTAMAETTVKVPFNFMVHGKMCPAGWYTVDRNPVSGAVTLESADGMRHFNWVSGPGDVSPMDTRVILRFDDHASTLYLRNVQYGPAITARLDGDAPEYVPSRIVQGQ